MESKNKKHPRKAIIVGVTGLIGGYCLQALIDEPNYSEIIAVTRKPLLKTHRKLTIITSTFDNLSRDLSHIQAHDVYCCLGTTIKKAGTEEAFRKVDLSLVLTVAETMREKGAEQFVVISSMGADSNSKIFYNRTKGEMELALRDIGYPSLRIIRPSLLLGSREEFRLGEKIGMMLTPVLRPFMLGTLKKYRPVHAESVARFMVKTALEETLDGVQIYESDMIE